MRNFAARFAGVFELDIRSLAAMRVLLGAVSLCSAVERLIDARALYSDAGVLPREIAERFVLPAGSLRLFFASGSTTFVVALLALHALASVALMLGWRTRAVTALCWLLALGARDRNLLAADSGDDLLVLLLFWSIFLPLGAAVSLDARKKITSAKRVFSAGSVGLVLQLACMYAFSAFFKSGSSWRGDHSALYLALSIDYLARPLGIALRSHRELCAFFTASTMALEMLGPWLMLGALVPKLRVLVRTAVPLAFIGLHVGIMLTMSLTLFPLAAIAAWIGVLPSELWEREKKTSERIVAPRWTQPLVIVAIAIMLACNVAMALPTTPLSKLSFIYEGTGLLQDWTMFGPNPIIRDGWYAFPAKLADGSEVDLFRDGPSTRARPRDVADSYRDRLWRNHLSSIADLPYAPLFPDLARYLCASWNAEHAASQRALSVEGIYMLEVTTPTDPAPPAEPLELFHFACE